MRGDGSAPIRLHLEKSPRLRELGLPKEPKEVHKFFSLFAVARTCV